MICSTVSYTTMTFIKLTENRNNEIPISERLPILNVNKICEKGLSN
jgi:hypothetical protein